MVVTHIDKLTQKERTTWFKPDSPVQEYARVVVKATGTPESSIFLVNNYSGERERDKFLETLVLLPLRQALRSAVEKLVAKEKEDEENRRQLKRKRLSVTPNRSRVSM